jgi:hypothetical protein
MKAVLVAGALLLFMAVPAFAQSEVNPHGALPSGMDCADCHSSDRWRPLRKDARFEHDKTGFRLVDKHAAAACGSCHSDLRFAANPTQPRQCVSCHTDVHQSRFGRDCASCHDTRSFNSSPGPQAHARTNLPLTGAHASVPCASCHRGEAAGSYTALDARCVSCHRADYEGVTLPNHVAGSFSQECVQCHNSLAWQGAEFAHTAFVLDGPHATASCTSCHNANGNGLLFPRPTGQQDCFACHRADYDDEHAGSGFPTTCLTCHRNGNDWDDASFEHASVSNGFALLGAHIRATCGSCHAAPDGRLKFDPKPSSPQECVACHNPDYDREHAGSGFSKVCLSCHNVERWEGAVFSHTRFPLTGAHQPLPCTACHVPPNNALIYPVPTSANDCVACHRADYDRRHTGSGFPTTCASCHSQDTWAGASFNHDQFFPIYSGKHAGKWSSCQQCHTVAGDYRVFSCTACHAKSKTDNDHSQVTGYSYDSNRCFSCHPRGD